MIYDINGNPLISSDKLPGVYGTTIQFTYPTKANNDKMVTSATLILWQIHETTSILHKIKRSLKKRNE